MLKIDLVRKVLLAAGPLLALLFYYEWLNVLPAITPRASSPLPARSGYDVLCRAAKSLDRQLTDENGYLIDRMSTGEKVQLVAANALALAATRAALSLPYVNPPSRPQTWPFEFESFLSLDELLRADAEVKIARGDRSSALGSEIDRVALSIDTARGGNLDTYLTAIDQERHAIQPIWEQLGKVDAVSAARAAARLEHLEDGRVSLADVLAADKNAQERDMLVRFQHQNVIQMELASRLRPSQAPDAGPDPEASVAETLAADRALITHSKRRVLQDYSTTMDALIADASKPFSWSGEAIASPPDYVNTDIFKNYVFVLASEDRLSGTQASAETELLTCSLALRAYRLRYGRYPTALSDIVSDGLLRHLPIDPYSRSGSEPLRYRRTDRHNYLLYSIGPDGIDDGGKPVALVDIDVDRLIDRGDKGDCVVGVNIGNSAQADRHLTIAEGNVL